MGSEALLLLALVPVIVASAISDLRYLRIPNTHVLIALALFVLAAPLAIGWAGLPPRLLVAGITFAIGFALFAPGLIGGGDAKMMPVVMLFVPPPDLVQFLQLFAIALGVVSLGVLGVQRAPIFRRLAWESVQAHRHVPVGLAMAASVILLGARPLLGG